jgi:Antp family protein
MSSYQFVNTLAQCYAEQTAAQQASQVGQDYYNMNYPNCYSPNLTNHSQYGQYSLMMSGQAAAAMAAGMADYGVTGGGGIPGGGGSTLTNNLTSSQTGLRRSANQSPSSAVINQISNNCKYSDSSVGGSPQDLRTSSAGGTPQPVLGSQKTSSSPVSQSPLSPMTSPAAVAAAAAAAVAAASAGFRSTSKRIVFFKLIHSL